MNKRVRVSLTQEEWTKLFKGLELLDGYKIITNKIKTCFGRSRAKLRYTTTKRQRVEDIIDKAIDPLSKVLRDNNYRKIAEENRDKLIENQTKYEATVKAVLKSLKIKYEFQHIFYNDETFYIVDFYLPDYSIVIEVDGVHHDEEEQKIKDTKRTRVLKRYNNIQYLARIPNKETLNTTILSRKIKAILKYALVKKKVA